MSTLSDRLRTAQRNTQPRGCRTCDWWQKITAPTRKLIDEWIDEKAPIAQLYYILATPTEDDEPHLEVSLTGFKFHLRHHHERCR